MKMYSYTLDGMSGLANEVREILVDTLEREGVIDPATAEKIRTEYAVMIVEKGFFGKAIDKMFGIGDEPQYQVVKLIKTTRKKYDNNQSEGSAE